MRLHTVHPDWYEDGIEGRGKRAENCFRLDFDFGVAFTGVFQAQLFLRVTGEGPEYGRCRLFVERDRRRDDDTDVRIDYASDAKPISQVWAAFLLAGGEAAFVEHEAAFVASVLALPCDVEMCDEEFV